MNQQITMMKPAALKPYEKNPRKNDDAVAAVAASIREFGFRVPIICDADHVIICGHTRLKAAEMLGLEEIPVIVADDLTPEQVRAFRLADNKTAELATWDEELLAQELAEICAIDMDKLAEACAIDMTTFGFESANGSKYNGTGDADSLRNEFIVPPFSVLNARMGYWRDRKKAWQAIGLQSDKGRARGLIGGGRS